jgi:putative endonuclease
MPGGLLQWISEKLHRPVAPRSHRVGAAGEAAARRHLSSLGWKYLTANFRGEAGEIDLVFRNADCLVCVEVKSRARGGWLRPAAAVTLAKRRRIARTALEYLRLAGNPKVNVRFDIVEVLFDGEEVEELRHLENSFPMPKPLRYY